MSNSILINSDSFNNSELQSAAKEIRRGGIVMFPTDTLYGLAVDPRNWNAIERLFTVKGRNTSNAVPMICADLEQVEREIGLMPDLAKELSKLFWPGPLTMVLDGKGSMAKNAIGFDGSVGVRVPSHPVARALADTVGHPITATSANRSGERASQSVTETSKSILESIGLILDAGEVSGGLPSTIVDVRTNPVRLIRVGAIPWEDVLNSIN
jgi:L-threonylcarbamoyladenylate synthase